MGGSSDTWSRYAAFLRQPPQRVEVWTDPESDARGWLVINSLRGGAAGGGTRMRPGLTREEVVYLAKTMELKFVFAGPPIGGAKSGIDFDPRDPQKTDVLKRWFRWAAPYLRECYGTAGDLNVSELGEVVPGCRAAGLRHPQEGIVRGHHNPGPADFDRIIRALDEGIGAPLVGELGIPGVSLTVSDVAAGYGLTRAIARLYRVLGRDLEGAPVIVQGFGHVGASSALFLARAGARVVGIVDAEKALVEPAGLEAEGVADLIRRRRRGLLPDDERCLRGGARGRLWDQQAEMLVAAAISNVIDRPLLARIEEAGISVLACGANHPFKEAAFGVTDTQREADHRFSIVADLIGSAGAACAYDYLSGANAVAEAPSILAAIDERLGAAVESVVKRNRGCPTGLLEATLSCALDRLEG